MCKKIFFALIVFTIFFGSFALLSDTGYEKLTVELEVEGDEALVNPNYFKVFSSPAGDFGAAYIILKNTYSINILDEPVFGLCFMGDMKIKSLEINGVKYSVGNLKRDFGGCEYATTIKKYNGKITNKFLKISHIFSCVVFTFFISALVWLAYKEFLLQKKSREYLASCSIALLFIGLLYLAVYPALYDIDLLNTIITTKQFFSDAWFTYLDNVWVMTMLNFWDSVRVFPFFSFSLLFLSIALYLKILEELGMLKKWKYYLFLFLLLPSVWSHVAYISRDIFANLHSLLLSMSFLLILILQKKKNLTKLCLLDFVAIYSAVFAMTIRTDLIPLGVIFIILYCKLRKLNLKQKALAIGFYAVLVTVSVMTRNTLTPDAISAKKIKAIVSISHPLSAILHSKNKKDITDSDLRLIDQYIDVEMLQKFYAETDVVAMHRGALRKEWKFDLGDLIFVTGKLIKNNPWVFLESRIKMFYHTFGSTSLTSLPVWQHFSWSDDQNIHSRNEAKVLNLYLPVSKTLTKKVFEVHQYATENFLFRSIYNTFPSLLLLIVSVLFFKYTPICASVSLFTLARVPILFILAPAAQHKYIIDMYFLGILILPIFIWEMKTSKTRLTVVEHVKA